MARMHGQPDAIMQCDVPSQMKSQGQLLPAHCGWRGTPVLLGQLKIAYDVQEWQAEGLRSSYNSRLKSNCRIRKSVWPEYSAPLFASFVLFVSQWLVADPKSWVLKHKMRANPTPPSLSPPPS